MYRKLGVSDALDELSLDDEVELDEELLELDTEDCPNVKKAKL